LVINIYCVIDDEIDGVVIMDKLQFRSVQINMY